MQENELVLRYGEYKSKLASAEKREIELRSQLAAREEELAGVMASLLEKYGIKSREELAEQIAKMSEEAEQILGRISRGLAAIGMGT